MAGERLEFHCACGDPGRRPDASRHPWAQFAGYGDFRAVTWYRAEADALVREPPVDVLNAPPVVGQQYWLRLTMPFGEQNGDAFWCLYLSPTAHFNGMEVDSDTFRSVHIVGCRLLDWSGDPKDLVIGRVEVVGAVTLDALDMLPRFPLGADMSLLGNFVAASPGVSRFGDIAHIEWNVEGDIGAWLIVRTVPEIEVLVVGEWGAHQDYFWAGRGVPGAKQLAELRMLLDWT